MIPFGNNRGEQAGLILEWDTPPGLKPTHYAVRYYEPLCFQEGVNYRGHILSYFNSCYRRWDGSPMETGGTLIHTLFSAGSEGFEIKIDEANAKKRYTTFNGDTRNRYILQNSFTDTRAGPVYGAPVFNVAVRPMYGTIAGEYPQVSHTYRPLSPSFPPNLRFEAGDGEGEVIFRWDARPSTHAGKPLWPHDSFDIIHWPVDGQQSNATRIKGLLKDQLQATATGLTHGAEYYARIVSTTIGGNEGPYSVPFARGVVATNSASAHLSLAEITDTNRESVRIKPDFSSTTFAYSASVNSAITQVTISVGTSATNVTSVTVNGQALTKGNAGRYIYTTGHLGLGNTDFTFRIISENGENTLDYVFTVQRVQAPAPPDQVTVVAASQRFDVFWNRPTDTGTGEASETVHYVLSWGPVGQSPSGEKTTDDGAASWRISGLTNGTRYFVRIKSVNTSGIESTVVERELTARGFDLDVDGDGDTDGLDGALITRYLAGYGGLYVTLDTDYWTINLRSIMRRVVTQRIQNGISAGVLDADNNGKTDIADGIMITRYLLDVSVPASIGGGQTSPDRYGTVNDRLRAIDSDPPG